MRSLTARCRTSTATDSRSIPLLRTGALGLAVVLFTLSLSWFGAESVRAVATEVDLGSAEPYSVLSGESVTNTGPSVLSGWLGVSPGTAVSGFPPGLVGGQTHVADAAALQAKNDLVLAYDSAAGQAPDGSISGDIGGTTILPGVYKAPSSILITGPLTLNAQGDPHAVFVFQIGSALTTATSSSVVMINGADSCNVFWQVGSSATLGTSTAFQGTIMALASISTGSGTTVDGRALARNGSVTLINTVFTDAACEESTNPPNTNPPNTNPPNTNPPATNPSPGAAPPPNSSSMPPPGSGGSGDSPDDLASTGSGPLPVLVAAAALAVLIVGFAAFLAAARPRRHS